MASISPTSRKACSHAPPRRPRFRPRIELALTILLAVGPALCTAAGAASVGIPKCPTECTASPAPYDLCLVYVPSRTGQGVRNATACVQFCDSFESPRFLYYSHYAEAGKDTCCCVFLFLGAPWRDYCFILSEPQEGDDCAQMVPFSCFWLYCGTGAFLRRVVLLLQALRAYPPDACEDQWVPP